MSNHYDPDDDLEISPLFVEQIVAVLREPIPPSPDFRARVMAEVRQYESERRASQSRMARSRPPWRSGNVWLAVGVMIVIAIVNRGILGWISAGHSAPSSARNAIAKQQPTGAQHEGIGKSAPPALVVPSRPVATVAEKARVSPKKPSPSREVQASPAPHDPLWGEVEATPAPPPPPSDTATASQTTPSLSLLDGRVSSAVRLAVARLADSLHSAGISPTLVIDKALEGATKGADDARILAAIQRVANDLVAVHQALPTATEAELNAGVSALQAGVPPNTLREASQALPKRSLAVPLAVLGALVRQGVPEQMATSAIVTVASHGDDHRVIEFGDAVGRGIAGGLSPQRAVQDAVGRIEEP